MLVESGDENDQRRARRKIGGDVDAIHQRHVNVEQQHVGSQSLGEPDGIESVARFADQQHIGQRLEHASQLAAGGRLVVGDQNAQGSVMRAHTPSGSRLTRTSVAASP